MEAKTTWILVADGARARIFTREGASTRLALLPEGAFTHEVHRASELGTDRPGRVAESANVTRHAIAPKVDWRREGKQDFARRLSEILEGKARQKAFDRLLLIAPPQMHGDLRRCLGPQARERLAGELDKDLTEFTAREIEERLIQENLL